MSNKTLSGLDKKFDITFNVNAYQADLLILLFQLLDHRIEYEEISNLESTDILVSELWDFIVPVQEVLTDVIGLSVSGNMKDIASLVRARQTTSPPK